MNSSISHFLIYCKQNIISVVLSSITHFIYVSSFGPLPDFLTMLCTPGKGTWALGCTETECHSPIYLKLSVNNVMTPSPPSLRSLQLQGTVEEQEGNQRNSVLHGRNWEVVWKGQVSKLKKKNGFSTASTINNHYQDVRRITSKTL